MTTAAPAVDLDDVGHTAGLLAALAEIDRLGWDSPPGDAVLRYARERVVGPAVHRAGLTGFQAADAVSAGWVAAWQMLCRPDLGTKRSPWGLVAAAVRREIANDQLSAAHRTNPRRAWRLERLHRAGADRERRPAPATVSADLGADAVRLDGLSSRVAATPVSLDALTGTGWEPPSAPPEGGELGPRLTLIVRALVAAGWPAALAQSSVAWIAQAGAARAASAAHRVQNREQPGWRALARTTGLHSWQSLRLTALLLGTPDQPGLLARMALDGDQVLREPHTQRQLRATVHRYAHTGPTGATAPALLPDRQAAA